MRRTVEQMLWFGSKPDRVIAKELGRSTAQVRQKRVELGIRAYSLTGPKNDRTPAQRHMLEQLFADLWELNVDIYDMARLFRHREAKAVRAHAGRLRPKYALSRRTTRPYDVL